MINPVFYKSFLGVTLPCGQGRSTALIRLAHFKSLQDSTWGFRWSPPPVAGSKHWAAPHIRLRPHTHIVGDKILQKIAGII